MTTYEAISIAVSLVAVLISVITFRIAGKANEIALGNIELYIRERISATRERINSISLSMGSILSKRQKTADEKRMLEFYEKAFLEAVEDNINAYEDACAKYLDKKIDQRRFERMFRVEIRQLVEHQDYKKYFDTITSKYECILKVYNKWEKVEK